MSRLKHAWYFQPNCGFSVQHSSGNDPWCSSSLFDLCGTERSWDETNVILSHGWCSPEQLDVLVGQQLNLTQRGRMISDHCVWMVLLFQPRWNPISASQYTTKYAGLFLSSTSTGLPSLSPVFFLSSCTLNNATIKKGKSIYSIFII